jgi:exonuclease III
LRIVTLNVNGIRSAASKGLFRWLAAQRADVVCLQEMKCQEIDLDARLHGLKVYQTCHAFAKKKGYSGVSLYSRKTPDEVRRGFASRVTPKGTRGASGSWWSDVRLAGRPHGSVVPLSQGFSHLQG